MSRSGYTDDGENVGLWRGAVRSAIRGERGQSFLREALAALDAMPVKELAKESLVNHSGEFCTLGVVGASRGIDMGPLDSEDTYRVADIFGIANSMACEIVYENDENDYRYEELQWVRNSPFQYIPQIRLVETPAERWKRMRAWLEKNIRDE